MKKSYNRSEIFARAWEIRRAAAAEIGCAVSAVIMSECLRMAWAEAEGVYAAANAAAVEAEFSVMNATKPEELLGLLRAMVRRAAKNEIGYTVEDQYDQMNELPAFSSAVGFEYDALADEAWCLMAEDVAKGRLTAKNESRAEHGDSPMTLGYWAYWAGKRSLQEWLKKEARGERLRLRSKTMADGSEYSYIDDVAWSHHYNTEIRGIHNAEFVRFLQTRDEYDAVILSGLTMGYTEREIAQHVPFTNVAVHKRIVKMREALAAHMGIAL